MFVSGLSRAQRLATGSELGRRATTLVALVGAIVAASGVAQLARAEGTAATVAEPSAATPSPSAAQAPDLRAAIRQVEKKGYRVEAPDIYSLSERLRVLLGKRPGAVEGADNRTPADQRAFFFEGDRFLGTDALTPSAGIRLAWHHDSTVALEYVLYRPGDAICCPTGGNSVVRFEVDADKLRALDPLPSDDTKAPLSRR